MGMIAFSHVNLLSLFLMMFTQSPVYGKIESHQKTHEEETFLMQIKTSIFLVFAIILVTIILGFMVFLTVYCCLKVWRQHIEPARPSSPNSMLANEITVFNDIGVPLTYESILHATGNFNRRNRIGRGGFGLTYKAVVAPGNTVAVKKLTTSRQQGVSEFDAEVNILSQLNHPNIVTLIGCYNFQEEMLIIYNYLPGGNLDQFIRARDRVPFNWDILHKITLNIASALSYLHELCDPHILHRDIKPSNILLDMDYNAYLSDFGLAKVLPFGIPSIITRIAGTYGYIAPEYASSGRLSIKVDVYSYGVVLLELMSDKCVLDPTFSMRENGFNIVSWARLLNDEHKVDEFFTNILWDFGPKDKLEGLLNVAVLCTAEVASVRPTMRRVIRLLEQLHVQPGE